MRVRSTRLAVADLGTALPVGPLAGSALAHDRRKVGPVQMVVGSLNDPACRLPERRPATSVRRDRTDHRRGRRPEGGGDHRRPEGRPASHGRRLRLVRGVSLGHGATRPGTCTFRFVGTVKGQQIDQSFTSSERTFDTPKETADIEFPVKDPSRGQLASRVDRIEPRHSRRHA